MRYVDFRDSIKGILERESEGLTWRELRERLDLPYRTPCPEWLGRMAREDGLVREPGAGRALIWKLEPKPGKE